VFGVSIYDSLLAHWAHCIILAPSTMLHTRTIYRLWRLLSQLFLLSLYFYILNIWQAQKSQNNSLIQFSTIISANNLAKHTQMHYKLNCSSLNDGSN